MESDGDSDQHRDQEVPAVPKKRSHQVSATDTEASQKAVHRQSTSGGSSGTRHRRISSSSSSSSDESLRPDDASDHPDTEKVDLSESRSQEKEDKEPRSGALDFDVMMEAKRAQNRRSRKRAGIDLINHNDDAMASLIQDMRQAAREDRSLNLKGAPATKKIALLPTVMTQLNKADLLMAFLDANILSVMRDWLTPLADRSLPHLQIRSKLLHFLMTMPIDDCTRLKESGIGKAVMYLASHPKETRENRDLARKLVSKWSRPIFRLNADFSSMSKDERQRRDREMAAKLQDAQNARTKKADSSQKLDPLTDPSSSSSATPSSSTTSLRPGDPGWVSRARVPMVDNKEYIVRPQWQSHADMSSKKTTNSKKTLSLLEKHKRKLMERRRASKYTSSVKLSLEGKRLMN